jgi:PKD repeat protein
MMNVLSTALRRALFVGVVVSTAAVGAVALAPSAAADTPSTTGPGPVYQRPSTMVTADALPTVQIDSGVVWSQAIVGNTVYAGGSFANTRPAGAAAGTNLTPRANLLAYDITTGNLITSFNPNLNAQVRIVTKSPDGSRIYIGGNFTQADGANRYLIAAYSTATGQLISSFAPSIGGSYVTSIAATNSTVYVGGLFTQANGAARQNLAAFSAATGALLAWAPTSTGQVDTMVMTPDNSRVIAGGRFTQVNGVADRGLAALDASTGALLPWAANQVIVNGDSLAGIYNLSTDGNAIYGTGWGFGSVNDGNLEGTFSADPDTGAINWVAGCHGDTYGSYSDGTTVYTVSHAHYCATVGGYPESNPRSINMRHSVAFTAAVTGVNGPDAYAGGTYYNWQGTPSPSIYDWFPDMSEGTYTGQNQAAWTVTGNGQYVVEGGEFPTVNYTTQQGLVRFAVPSIAPKKQGPRMGGSGWVPSVMSIQPGTARISFGANQDRDDKTLTYQIIRDNKTNAPIYTTTADSEFWNMPTLSYMDTGLTAGSTHTYQVIAKDPDGNTGYSQTVSVTITSTSPSAYAQQVLGDGAGLYWRLDEPSGTAAFDWAGANDGVVGAGVTRGTAGAIIGDTDTASTFSGTSTGTVSTQTAIAGPNTFTVSAWFKTASGYNKGGKIIGFGNASSGNSSSYDRHVYMDNSGKIWFGVYPGSVQTLNSTASYNDGKWHQVVASLGANGMALYIDGQPIASRTDVTGGQAYNGYWRVGGDNLGSWTSAPSSNYFAGAIDEVAIFPTVLTRAQVHTEYAAAGYASAGPTDPYGAAVVAADPDLFWRLDDAAGSTTAADSGFYNNPGTRRTGVSFGATGIGLTGVTDTAATFNGGSSGSISANKTAVNPAAVTEAAWIKTTTNSGGMIIGMGKSASSLSTTTDHQVYMLNNGRIAFSVNGITATTTQAYNDGNWHQVVATQSSSGLQLYVDGTPRAGAAASSSKSLTGYWRVGGDNLSGLANKPSSNFFAGTVDEVAVYPTALTSDVIANQYFQATGVMPNRPPVPSFTATAGTSGVSFDASGSTDPDGNNTISGYAWNFGDGTTGTGVTATHSYAVPGAYLVTLTVTDNQAASASTTQRVVAGDAYTSAVNANSPYLFWRLSDVAGTTAVDSGSNGNNGSYQGGVTLGATGPLPGTGAAQFNGVDGVVVSPAAIAGPSVYTEEAWFSTTSTSGGKIIGFGDAASGNSSNYDRHIYMDPTGHLNFGAWTGTANVATSPLSYNDGAWHQVVATQGPDGMSLYVDGQVVATNPQTGAQAYNGYFRVGGDSTWAGNPYFQGTIANASVYLSELTASQVLADYAVGSGTSPTARFTSSSASLTVSVDGSTSTGAAGRALTYAWNFGDGQTGTGATTTHAYAADGTYTVALTVTDDHGLTSSVSHSVTVHQAPTAAFTPTVKSLSVALDGTASAAAGTATISSYDWNFGDGSAHGTGATATHAYAAAGTYPVTLTVTDSQGATGTIEHDVVVAHTAPVAAFTPTISLSDLSVDASASTASDSATLSYDWSWGDGSPDGSGVTATHHYAAVGSYPVTLTVTDSLGGVTTVSHTVTASTHAAPVASFTSSASGLTASLNGSGSSASDGASISSYDWNFGDGSSHGTGATPSHAYATAGTYSVTLTVTDSMGAVSAPVTKSVTVTHAAPVAVIKSATASGLALSVDGTGSSASDGATLSYDWNWGDGTTDGSGVTATHTYAAAGTYQVKLTVTDSLGTASAPATASVTVTSVAAADAFGRTLASGWGSADTGGAWTLSGSSSLFTVSGGVGTIKMATAGSGPSAYLNSVSARDVDATIDVSLDKVPTGNGAYITLGVRHTSAGDYRAKVQYLSTGGVKLILSTLVGSTETELKSTTVSGLTASAGDVLRIELVATGSGTTTLQAKVWKASGTVPSSWQLTATDSTAALQAPGGIAVVTYLTGTATNAPVTASFDNLTALKAA